MEFHNNAGEEALTQYLISCAPSLYLSLSVSLCLSFSLCLPAITTTNNHGGTVYANSTDVKSIKLNPTR